MDLEANQKTLENEIVTQCIASPVYGHLLQLILDDPSITVKDLRNLRQINNESYEKLSERFCNEVGTIVIDLGAKKSKNINQNPNKKPIEPSKNPIPKITRLFKKKRPESLTLPPMTLIRTMKIINKSWTVDPKEAEKFIMIIRFAPEITKLCFDVEQIEYLNGEGLLLISKFTSLKNVTITQSGSGGVSKDYDWAIALFIAHLPYSENLKSLTLIDFNFFIFDDWFQCIMSLCPNLKALNYNFTMERREANFPVLCIYSVQQFLNDENYLASPVMLDSENLQRIYIAQFEENDPEHIILLESFVEVLSHNFKYCGIIYLILEEGDNIEPFEELFAQHGWEWESLLPQVFKFTRL